MLRDWDKRYPGRIETMFSAMQNVVPSHLCDTNLFDFKGITHGSEVVDGGDLAFDREEIPLQPAGWQPEEDDTALEALRLDVIEVKIICRRLSTPLRRHAINHFNSRTRHDLPLIFRFATAFQAFCATA
ncbi:tRNA(Cytosine32)-2-thiocytidine synthetase [Salmonella enterica subsp. enterica]|uniref:tRNA(Cytosine32)-2-thiocytidine synthetase n=1 Tax=Salmonella enterica I TaxID=59201 RepID=A0A379WT65_SALET|nr:tRNA(Cytosine32)-2-thiocytidine synthetase [Salmonella enterica subsp. enterica]